MGVENTWTRGRSEPEKIRSKSGFLKPGDRLKYKQLVNGNTFDGILTSIAILGEGITQTLAAKISYLNEGAFDRPVVELDLASEVCTTLDLVKPQFLLNFRDGTRLEADWIYIRRIVNNDKSVSIELAKVGETEHRIISINDLLGVEGTSLTGK